MKATRFLFVYNKDDKDGREPRAQFTEKSYICRLVGHGDVFHILRECWVTAGPASPALSQH